MPTTNAEFGTNVEEIADGIYRINTPLSEQVVPGGFSFNQYLILDEEPLLFHTGPRKLFPLVREAVAAVIPVGRLRYVGLSHVEADECGSINEWLAAAPRAEPLCGQVAAMVSMGDLADRPPRAVADGETISLGTHRAAGPHPRGSPPARGPAWRSPATGEPRSWWTATRSRLAGMRSIVPTDGGLRDRSKDQRAARGAVRLGGGELPVRLLDTASEQLLNQDFERLFAGAGRIGCPTPRAWSFTSTIGWARGAGSTG